MEVRQGVGCCGVLQAPTAAASRVRVVFKARMGSIGVVLMESNEPSSEGVLCNSWVIWGCAVIFCAERSFVVVAFYAKLYYAHGEGLMWNQSKQAHKERVSQARVLCVTFTCCVFYTNGCYMHLHIHRYKYIYTYIPVGVCFTRWKALFTVYLYICVNMWWKMPDTAIYLIDISE